MYTGWYSIHRALYAIPRQDSSAPREVGRRLDKIESGKKEAIPKRTLNEILIDSFAETFDVGRMHEELAIAIEE